MKRKYGFTIVELLMVITVIGVLLGIVTTAATASMRSARERRASVMKTILEGGLAVYHRQHDEWPGVIEDYAKEGKNHVLSSGEYDKVVQKLLEQSSGTGGANPVLDPTGLMVMNAGSPDGKTTGIDYRTALTELKMKDVKSFTIVYPISDSGKAKRFKISYVAASDSVSVGL